MEKQPYYIRKYFSTRGLFYHGPWNARTTDEFVIIAKMIHGDRYGYEKVVYKRSNIPVEIECKRHGVFTIIPHHFFEGQGCPQCTQEKRSKYTDKNLFIKRARELHPKNDYDYTSTEYVSIHDPIKILCRKHGYFTSTVSKHLHHWGCPQCKRPKHIDNALFLSRAKRIHGNTYDYSKIGEIKKGEQKVTIICPEHGEFTQTVQNHIGSQKQGCPGCGWERMKTKTRSSYAEFLTRARETHGNKYTYVKESYIKMKAPVTIICPEHGPFSQDAQAHVSGIGCSKCGYQKASKSKTTPFPEFIRKANKIHANKYTYEESSYIDTKHQLTIICPEHGPFLQNGHSHLIGSGCPKCGRERIKTKLRSSYSDFLTRARKTHGNKYTYVKESYSKMRAPVTIICPEHGPFLQDGSSHLAGQGCPKCANLRKGRVRNKPINDRGKK